MRFEKCEKCGKIKLAGFDSHDALNGITFSDLEVKMYAWNLKLKNPEGKMVSMRGKFRCTNKTVCGAESKFDPESKAIGGTRRV